MRPTLIAGNWKMNGSRAGVDSLVSGILRQGPFGCQVLLVPSFVFLEQVERLIVGTAVALGAQDIDPRPEGAVTGGISVSMVREFGCGYALVGHSERRTLFAETDDQVAEKFKACIHAGMTPILCVGETRAEREADSTDEVIAGQLAAVLAKVGVSAFATAVIAYEPVWAIGTGLSATPVQAQAVHEAIRAMLAAEDQDIAAQTQLLYGGSVNRQNAEALLAQPDIDGALIGGASLKADEFGAICRMAEGAG